MQIMTLRLIWDLVGKKHFLLFVLVMLSFPLIVGSGIIALPDTPLLFFGKYHKLSGACEKHILYQSSNFAIHVNVSADIFYKLYNKIF